MNQDRTSPRPSQLASNDALTLITIVGMTITGIMCLLVWLGFPPPTQP